MTMHLKTNAICTAGLPGAGKGLFVKAADQLGIKSIIMGDVIREGAIAKYGSATPTTTGKYMLEIREAMGRDAVAKLVVDKLVSSRSIGEYILIDGVRCIEELNYFKKTFSKVILIAVLADLEIRFKRVISRGRPDDIMTLSDFIARENRELSVGVGEVIKEADYYFINNYESEGEAIEKAKGLLINIIKLMRYEE